MPKTTEAELSRCETAQPDVELKTQKITVEKETGDLVFWAVAVDKKKTPNRLGFIFDWATPADVDVRNLQKNPMLLYRHDSENLSVGRIEDIEVTAKRVRMKCRIPNYPELEPLRRWIQDGYLRAVSIGFYIIECEAIEKQDAVRVSKLEIVELSICTIGAHETALIQQGMAEQIGSAWMRLDAATWLEEADGNRTLYRLSLSEPEPRPEAEEQDTETQADTWRAIPYSRHSDAKKADEGAGWNGPAEVKAADPADLKAMCVFENREALDVKGGYKLPHHQAKDNAVVWRGAAAALGVLLGARGGVKGVSDAVKKQGYAHLKKHYEAFEKEAPEFQAYSADELKALHEAGQIIVPGMEDDDTGVVCVVAMDEDYARRKAEQAVADATRPLQDRIVELEAQLADSQEKAAQEPPAGLPPAELSETDLQRVRILVKAELASNPDLQALLEKCAAETVKAIRRGKR